MIVLGVSDGAEASASLVIDHEVVAVEYQSRLERRVQPVGFPWAAVDSVLDVAGIRHRHVDQVAIAGQFTPPFYIRKKPQYREAINRPVSPLHSAHGLMQGVFRHTGIGAYQADRVGEWFENLLGKHGFSPDRVIMVDAHQALADAAYRSQEHDKCLVLTAHPNGDGLVAAVHRGENGQLQRLWTQVGYSKLEQHFFRCLGALGLDSWRDWRVFWELSRAGEADRDLLERLRPYFSYAQGRFSTKRWQVRDAQAAEVYGALGEIDAEDAAATVYETVRSALLSFATDKSSQFGVSRIAVGGSLFAIPRIACALEDLAVIKGVSAFPNPGWGSMSYGAAVSVAGVAPKPTPTPGLGRQYHEKQLRRAMSMAGLSAVGEIAEPAVVRVLAEGRTVARFGGVAGLVCHGEGTRTAFVRADEAGAVERLRTSLGRPEDENPVCIWMNLEGEPGPIAQSGLEGFLAHGSAAVMVQEEFARKYPATVGEDGAVVLLQLVASSDTALARVLTQLHEQTGCAALAGFPLASDDLPMVNVPGDAIRIWQRKELDLLWLGTAVIRRSVDK